MESGKKIRTPLEEGIKRFKQDSLAKFGVFGIIFLFLTAVFAPLIANGRPLILFKNGALSFPFLHFIFAPDSTEIIVEKFFNFILVLSPFLLILYILKKRKVRFIKTIASVIAIILIIPFFMTRQVLEKSDWRKEAQKLGPGEFAIFAPVPYGPFENVGHLYEKPSLSKHIFGTDEIGRDVFSRMVFGARISLAVGIFATGIAITIGIIVGLISGYYSGKTDFYIMRLVEIVICFPTFLLLLILMSYLMQYNFQQSILLVIGVIGLTAWTGLTRIIRGEILKLREQPFIQACEVLAIPTWRIMLFHLMPNLIVPIMISFTFGIAGAILTESSLSFLGFGVQDPTASWGELLRQSFEDPRTYWHLTLFPGLALFIAVLSFNYSGEGLRKSLDPKS